jgi:nucleotide-binding universal stress UspA family protein
MRRAEGSVSARRGDNRAVSFKRVMVPYDGSPGARRALEVGVDLARSTDAELLVLAIEAHLPHFAATVGEVQEEQLLEESEALVSLSEAEEYARRRGTAIRTEVRAGRAPHTIVATAKEHDVDLIVIGQSGHSGLLSHLLGTADRVSEQAPCSVLIAR